MSNGLTHDECRQAADKFGIDLTCGECASVFYTGHSSAPHEAECKTLPFLRQLAGQECHGRSWREHVQHEAGNDDTEASPSWHKGVPLCVESCSHHDGKRCQVLGVKPGRICEPVVVQMSRLIGS